MPVVDIHDGQSINIGNPDGPRLTFEVGRHQGWPGARRRTESMGIAVAPQPSATAWPASQTSGQPGHPSPLRPDRRQRARRLERAARAATASRRARSAAGATGTTGATGISDFGGATARLSRRPPARYPPPHGVRCGAIACLTADADVAREAKPPEVANLATKMFQALLPSRSGALPKPSGALTIGRATDNDIVIQDVLASRHHAFLTQTPLGTEIRDAHSINGTFVNGVRVGSAVLTEGDVVTIGNVDLVFTRRHPGPPHRSGDAHRRPRGELRLLHVEGKKQLLDHISLTARPGTLTAIIGGSGAGKTTLSRLIAGYTSPTSAR